MAPRRRSRERCSTLFSTPTQKNTPTSIAGCITSQPRHREFREGARDGARLPQCPLRRRDHLHPQRHRGHQSGGAAPMARPHIGEGDEIVLSIMEHHSNIVPWYFLKRAARRRPEMGADLRRRRAAARQVRGAAHPAHQDGRHHPYVERARHHRPDQGGGPHGARPRHPRAGRRRARRGASAGRCAGSRLRLLCLHRP